MSWSGTMSCVVSNQTGGPITNVNVSHTFSGTTDHGSSGSLPINGDFSFEINVGSGGNDDWALSFETATGVVLGCQSKQCNVEESDYQSGSPVRVVLYNASTGFDIATPVSSPCLKNSYD